MSWIRPWSASWQSRGAVLLCGRYEGIDQRVLDRHVTLEISLGDFVLSGGELPALAMLDAVARLQDGVLGDAQSHQQDSFSTACWTVRTSAVRSCCLPTTSVPSARFRRCCCPDTMPKSRVGGVNSPCA